MQTTVVRARQKGVRGYVSIGRPGCMGNPYRVGDPHPATGFPLDLRQVLVLYEFYLMRKLDEDADFHAAFLALRGQTLGCPCSGAAADPKEGERCHGHVMLRVLGEMGEGAR